MTDPMAADRLAEISRQYDGLSAGAYSRNHAVTHTAELLAEVKRLNERLAEYVGWEPTVKEEYEHACAVAERAEEAVREFKRGHEGSWTGPDQNEAVTAFVAALENALEMR
jgi:hypothetical protein